MIMPEYIDIHCHISSPNFDGDREAVIGRINEKNIWAVDVGVDFESSKKASENALVNQDVFASAGLHPTDNEEEVFNAAFYKKLFENPKVVAVGECGLDYFRIKGDGDEEKKRQRDNFEMQIKLALALNKPLMLHCRDAYTDILEILDSYSAAFGSKLRGNIHFFAGSWKEAKRFLDIGFMLSFTGVITFARDYDEVIKNAPIDMIMAETDSPFVAPAPYRGKRNEPVYVVEIVKKIAQIRGEDLGRIKYRILENSLMMFDLKY